MEAPWSPWPISFATYKLHGVAWSPDGPMALHAKLLFDPILQAFHLDVTEAQAPCLCSDFEWRWWASPTTT